MKTFFKNKIVTVLILLATLVLAGVAIFTAIRLYQLRQQAVAPTAPTSKPEAAAPNACTALTFTLEEAAPGISCTTKRAWEDDIRNASPNYYLITEISSDSTVDREETFVYTVAYQNTGTSAASGVTITDVLPAGLEFRDAGTGCTYSSSTRTVTCNIGTVNAGGSSQKAIRVRVLTSAAIGSFTNTGTLNSTEGTASTCQISLAVSAATSTPTPTGSPTSTPTATPTGTTTPTPAEPSLPEAGTSWPTILGMGIGILLLLGSLLLAL